MYQTIKICMKIVLFSGGYLWRREEEKDKEEHPGSSNYTCFLSFK